MNRLSQGSQPFLSKELFLPFLLTNYDAPGVAKPATTVNCQLVSAIKLKISKEYKQLLIFLLFKTKKKRPVPCKEGRKKNIFLTNFITYSITTLELCRSM